MNQLLVKIKNNARSTFDGFRKILSNENCYSIPQNLQAVPYNPNTLLEDGQWYSLSQFSEQNFCLSLLKENSFDSVNFETLDNRDFKKIDYLCSFQENVYYFQKVRPSQLVEKKRVVFGEPYRFVENSKSIDVNYYPDAFYDKNSDMLYFQKLETISSIFRGIDTLYREATEEETDTFLQNDFFEIAESFNSSKVGKANRKRIAMAMTTFNNFSREQKEEILAYTRENSGLELNENSFKLTSDEDLKKFMWGIFERYYETPVSREKRVANSIINLQNGVTQTDEI